MATTKKDLAERVAAQTGLRPSEALGIVNQFFETIKDAVSCGERVQITHFGAFEPRDKSARPGRNPKTLEKCTISARRVVTFKAAPKFRTRVRHAEKS